VLPSEILTVPVEEISATGAADSMILGNSDSTNAGCCGSFLFSWRMFFRLLINVRIEASQSPIIIVYLQQSIRRLIENQNWQPAKLRQDERRLKNRSGITPQRFCSFERGLDAVWGGTPQARSCSPNQRSN